MLFVYYWLFRDVLVADEPVDIVINVFAPVVVVVALGSWEFFVAGCAVYVFVVGWWDTAPRYTHPI